MKLEMADRKILWMPLELPPETNRVSIRPGVSVLSVLRHLNYKTYFALAEFVDNAVQSYGDNKDLLHQMHGAFWAMKRFSHEADQRFICGGIDRRRGYINLQLIARARPDFIPRRARLQFDCNVNAFRGFPDKRKTHQGKVANIRENTEEKM